MLAASPSHADLKKEYRIDLAAMGIPTRLARAKRHSRKRRNVPPSPLDPTNLFT